MYNERYLSRHIVSFALKCLFLGVLSLNVTPVFANSFSLNGNPFPIGTLSPSEQYYRQAGMATCNTPGSWTNNTGGERSLWCIIEVFYKGTGDITRGKDLSGKTYADGGVDAFDIRNSVPNGESVPVNISFTGYGVVSSAGADVMDPDWYASTQICAVTVVSTYKYASGTGTAKVPYNTMTELSRACDSVPPPDNAVVCTASSFTIDHGQISPATFNGNEKSGTGTVKCTGGSASVKLYFSSSTISFSNGGKSGLTFSNGSTSEIVNATENVSTSFTVKSHLSSPGAVKTGDFSGSTTIITDMQ